MQITPGHNPNKPLSTFAHRFWSISGETVLSGDGFTTQQSFILLPVYSSPDFLSEAKHLYFSSCGSLGVGPIHSSGWPLLKGVNQQGPSISQESWSVQNTVGHSSMTLKVNLTLSSMATPAGDIHSYPDIMM